MSSVQFTWQADHDPTTVKLSSPDGTFGIRRVDNNLTVVENGTPMESSGDGTYSYSFEDVAGAATYEAYIKIIDGPNVIFIHRFLKGRLGIDGSINSIDCAANVILSTLIELGLATDFSLYDPKDITSKRNWPGVVGGLQPDPDEMIALYDSGGIVDGILQMGEGPMLLEHPDVQLRLRGKKGSYASTKQVARIIKDRLMRTRNYEISVSNEIVSEPPEMYRLNAVTPLGKESYLGLDDRGRPSFTVNVRTSITRLNN